MLRKHMNYLIEVGMCLNQIFLYMVKVTLYNFVELGYNVLYLNQNYQKKVTYIVLSFNLKEYRANQ